MTVAFDDKSAPPDDAALAKMLGKSNTAWRALAEHLAAMSGVEVTWKFYGAKHGWQLKATRGRKAVMYMIPKSGRFVAATALPRAAVEAIDDAGLPAALVAEIRGAKAYAEGTPARVEVAGKRELAVVQRLLALK